MQSQSLAKKKAGEHYDAAAKASTTIRRDPATGRLVFDIRNWSPEMLPGLAQKEIQGAAAGPKVDAAIGMQELAPEPAAQQQDEGEEFGERLQRDETENLRRLYEGQSRELDAPADLDSWRGKYRASRSLNGSPIGAFVDAFRVGRSISKEDAQGQIDMDRAKKKQGMIDQIQQRLPPPGEKRRVAAAERAERAEERRLENSLHDPQRLSMIESEEEFGGYYERQLRDLGLEDTPERRERATKEWSYWRGQQEKGRKTSIDRAWRQAPAGVLDTYASADEWIAAVEAEAGEMTPVERGNFRGRWKTLEKKRREQEAAEARRDAARAPKPVKTGLTGWSDDEMISSLGDPEVDQTALRRAVSSKLESLGEEIEKKKSATIRQKRVEIDRLEKEEAKHRGNKGYVELEALTRLRSEVEILEAERDDIQRRRVRLGEPFGFRMNQQPGANGVRQQPESFPPNVEAQIQAAMRATGASRDVVIAKAREAGRL
jgi:hypothetical protein